jgi:hypothetical protein
MEIGDRFTTRFRVPHRIDAIIVAFDRDTVVVDAFHRCEPFCWLLRDFAHNLKIDGPRMKYAIDRRRTPSISEEAAFGSHRSRCMNKRKYPITDFCAREGAHHA